MMIRNCRERALFSRLVHCIFTDGILLGKEQPSRCSLSIMAVPLLAFYTSLIREGERERARNVERWGKLKAS